MGALSKAAGVFGFAYGEAEVNCSDPIFIRLQIFWEKQKEIIFIF
jgi:hypothetical protein